MFFVSWLLALSLSLFRFEYITWSLHIISGSFAWSQIVNNCKHLIILNFSNHELHTYYYQEIYNHVDGTSLSLPKLMVDMLSISMVKPDVTSSALGIDSFLETCLTSFLETLFQLFSFFFSFLLDFQHKKDPIQIGMRRSKK